MSNRPPKVPSYRLHKGSGQALVQVNGRRLYLGRHGSPESLERYHRVVAEWLASGLPPQAAPCATREATAPPLPDGTPPLSVAELVEAYWGHAKAYYTKHGRPTGETDNIRNALKFLLRLHAHSAAAGFGPRALLLVRQAMIEAGLTRRSINGRVSRVKRLYRWASEQELVLPSTYHGLLSVRGLQRGRSAARETEPVTTVPEEHVKAVLPFLTPQVRAMVQAQELAAMRPQDVRNLRTGDLDMSGDVWVYSPWTHKTEHHGHVRRIALGPRAQSVLRPFLKPSAPSAYVFTPAEAVNALRAARAGRRKTRRTPSELRRGRKDHPCGHPGASTARLATRGRSPAPAAAPACLPGVLTGSGTTARR
jgi:hypothetical protein